MNTITQLVRPIQQQDSNKLERSISRDGLRKLLFVDAQSNEDSSGLVERLQDLEASVLEISRSSDDLFALVKVMQADVLILSVEILEKSSLVQLTKIHETCPLPVIVIAKQYSKNIAKSVISAGVSSYLVDDVSIERLAIIIDLSIARFKQEQALICELQLTKEKLSERKLIERAKGIIMTQKNLSEEDAYSQMRKSAMNQGRSMVDLAKRIISVFDLLE